LYGGVVFNRASDTRISTLKDLIGHRVAAVHEMSLGGWVALWRELTELKIDPFRDFSYLRALEKQDFVRAKEILLDIDRAYGEALKYTDSSDYLVLLTTGDSKFVDMPDQGKAWYDYEKDNKNISAKRTKLTNLVLASGSRAENFCGMYDDSSVFERILSGPKQQGLELKIINPFK
jgi:hypothetical protein